MKGGVRNPTSYEIILFFVFSFFITARSQNCSFRCAEGTCLDHSQRCDGLQNCENGEDENFCESTLSGISTVSAPDLIDGCIIPNHQLNGKLSVFNSEESNPGDIVPEESAMFVGCDDGFSPSESYLATCSNKKFGCNYVEESCTLPPLIKNGWWLIGKNRGLLPGTKVSNIAVLRYSCYPDYSLSGDRNVYCINGSWTSEPKCYRHCDPIASLSVRLTCRRGPSGSLTPCDKGLPSGTVVTSVCNAFYKTDKPLVQMKCFDGKWDQPMPQCEPFRRNENPIPRVLSAEDNCRMPPNPPNGRFIAGANRDIPAGFSLPGYAVLFVECDPGYAPTEPKSLCSFIDRGQWSRLSECLKMCSPPIVPHSSIVCESVDPSLLNNKPREPVSCSMPMISGSSLKIECKSSYYTDSLIPQIFCKDGEWDSPMPVCKPRNLGNYIPVLTNGSCVLPDHDPNGHFHCPNNLELTTGDVVPKSSILIFRCNPGYYLEGNNVSICLQNNWNNIPKCLKTCDLFESVTLDFSCSLNGVYINCSEPLRNGTIVISKCKSSYSTSQFVLPFITCLEGNWDRPPPRCTPECGTLTPKSEEKIISGRSAELGEFPWHTALYDRRKFTNVEQICGGSIVNALVVISAAHCVWDSYNMRAHPSSHYAVAAGKLYRDWNSPEDDVTLVQKFNISHIYVPSTYGGEAQNQQSDIAILVVKTPFRFTFFIRPVCVNWDPQFDKFQLSNGNLGEVSGWGLTDVANTSSSSPVLKTIKLPYVDYSTCKELTPRTFQSLLVFDKFCAGYYKNGSAVCRGDSGGGLVFRSYELFTERYFLRGIVSVGPRNDLQMESCRDDTFTAFTHLLAHEQWVKDKLLKHIPQ